jgi:hypothetical protein
MLELKGAIFTENKENKVIDDEMMAKDTLFSIDQLLQFYFEEEYKQGLIHYKKNLEQIPIEVMKKMLA